MILIGNCGKDPEITHVPSLDKDVAKFSLATNEVFMDKNTNQFQEQTEWHNIVAWGWTAKKVERSVKRGGLVLVEGKIKTRKWQDKNGQDRWTTEIMADSITSLEKTGGQDQGGYGAPGVPAGGYGGGAPQQQTGGDPYGGGQYGGQAGGQQQGMNPQAPPEMQINDVNDIPYDDSDPF